jgi:SPP1 gp7 family putative phage head morphogenesis protein
MAFDVANPEAIAWAERNAARLVTDITTEAQAAIRTIVTDAFANGVSPSETAKLIRASIGLTERDAQAVMNAQLKWIAEGVTNATERAEKYAAKLTRRRAQTIARTETMRAANEGQQQLWEQAREAGLLDRTAKKVWIVADPCPICAGMSGETVRIDQTFSIGGDPPAHPNCRCTVGLVA